MSLVITRASKQAARYTDAGGRERCSGCRFFMPQGTCGRIVGPVSPRGWCRFFSQEVVQRWQPGSTLGSPGAVASLDIGFYGPPLDPHLTFTRASTATYFDVTGTMQTAAINAPRFDYDPVTQALRGLLIEEQRTNNFIWSSFASVWTPAGSGAAAPTVTDSQTTSPDGTVDASRVVYPAVSVANNFSALSPGITATTNPYSFSVYLRGNVGGERLYLFALSGATYYRTQVVLTTAWQRFVLNTPALTAASWIFAIGTDLRDVSQTATSAQTIFAWGAQVEQGAFATSYVPTTGATATRAKDVALLSTTGWFNADGTGTFNAEVMTQANTAALQRIIGSAVSGITPLFVGVTNGYGIYDGGVVLNTANTVPNFSVARPAGRTSATTLSVCVAGGAIASTPVGGGFSTMHGYMQLGGDGGATDYMTGYLRRVRYWPRVLSDAELQSVTI